MDLKLNGRIAIITGGSKGIGLRTATVLAQEGCAIGICGRNDADVDAAVSELETIGNPVFGMAADVCRADDCRRFVEGCAAALGGIDILINNVGGAVGGSLLESSDADWRDTFEINLFQTIRMSRLAAGHIAKRGGGAIVNIASISGMYVQLAGNGQYGSSKASIIFATERLALELSEHNIRVNTVSPGSIIWDGNGWDQMRKTHPAEFGIYEREGFPMGRLGKPEEVADVAAFIASPRANWINGRNIPVDGCEQPRSWPTKAFRGW